MIETARNEDLVPILQLLRTQLEEHDIVTSSRRGNLRISPHFYNDHEDIDKLFRALRKQRHLLL